MANVRTDVMPDAIKRMYVRQLQLRALPRLLYGRFGKTATWTGYDSAEIRKYNSLPIVSVALTEGTTPAEHAAPTISTVVLTPEWYGAWVGYTDKLKIQQYDDVIAETSQILGEQAGLSVDTLVREYITTAANCTKQYSGSATSRATAGTGLDSNNDKIGYIDFVKALATLETNGARPVDGGYFPVIMHPHSWATLMMDSTFVALFTREGGGSIRSGNVGTILQARIYLSYNAKEWTDGGEDSADDVYSALFIGRDSFVVSGMTGMAPNWNPDGGAPQPHIARGQMTGQRVVVTDLIVKGLGETGHDPLNQRGTIGWKLTHTQDTLNSAWVLDLEHCNDFSAS